MKNNNDFIKPLNTAVLLLVFNRLDTTIQVFKEIQKAKPVRLYIASDGARRFKNDEDIKVKEVRDYILKHIDWECEVKTLFREENLGCGIAVSEAISWFFENEEMGIILEDDCLPSQSFFWYCEELLQKYKNDMRVWHIGGTSTLNEEILLNDDSYYFSNFNHIWGWASWSNRWMKYDINMSLLDEFIENKFIENISQDKLLKEHWMDGLKSVFEKKIDTWDYQWYFTTWINGGISIIPTRNLVSNIGFGPEATHTSDADSKLSNQPKKEMSLNFIHPKLTMINTIYDNYNAKFLFNLSPWGYYKNKMKKMIRKVIKRP